MKQFAIFLLLIGVTITGVNVLLVMSTQATPSPQAERVIFNDKLSSALAENVYQQQVHALWANRDLLKVVADELHHSNTLAKRELSLVLSTNAILVGVLCLLVLSIFSRAIPTDAKGTPSHQPRRTSIRRLERENAQSQDETNAQAVAEIKPNLQAKKALKVRRYGRFIFVSLVLMILVAISIGATQR